MADSQGMSYTVDMVLCIDVTGSMSPIIDEVKGRALKLHEDINKQMSDKGKIINNLRIKVIGFGDLSIGEAMKSSKFFSLPGEKEDLSRFINSLNASGGGDEPESALEALDEAIKSDWTVQGEKRRQLIVMWTDASGRNDKPNLLNDLTDNWQNNKSVSSSAKRLIVYAPEAFPWSQIGSEWENTVYYSSAAGKGLDDVDYEAIIQTIANSVG